MRQQLIDLYEIQKIDLDIRELELSRDKAPERLTELEAEISRIQEELAPMGEESAGIEEEIRVLQAAVRNEGDKLRKWEKRLTDIRNQREYLALSREIEGSRRANNNTEDKIVELSLSQEAIAEKMEELKDALAENEIDADEERNKFEARKAQMNEKVKSETDRREKLVGSVKSSLLRKYDSIRKKRMGVGLIAAHAGSCCGCNIRLPPQLFNVLQRADTLEQCPSCQRIMVFQGIIDEHEGPAAVDPATADAETAAEKTASA